MSIIHPQDREISVKIVYYGPGLGGKTTSLQAVHRMLKPDARGQLISLATGADRTLYFDFLPIRTRMRDYAVRVQLYTVPGQVYYNSTRKLVLSGADGVVFVADSQVARLAANDESLANLEENLRDQGMDLARVPFVLQFNKRDAPEAVPLAELQPTFSRYDVPSFETVATTGRGVFPALKEIIKLVLRDLKSQGALAARSPTATPVGGVPILPKPKPSEPAPSPVDEMAREVESMQTSFPASPTLTSALERFAESIEEKMAPVAAQESASIPPLVTGSRSFSELVSRDLMRAAILDVETAIDAGRWSEAVKVADGAFRELASEIAGPGASPNEAAAMTALMLGVGAARLQRYIEIQLRALTGAVTQQDALLCLLFLADAAVSADGG